MTLSTNPDSFAVLIKPPPSTYFLFIGWGALPIFLIGNGNDGLFSGFGATGKPKLVDPNAKIKPTTNENAKDISFLQRQK
jgi:hypothetical protein